MKRASDLLQAFFLRNGIEEGQDYVSFFRKWQQIVGEDLAAHTDVEDIRNGALVVRVDHPAWMQILHMKKDLIIHQVCAEFPQFEVTTLHMHLDTEGTRTSVGPQSTVLSESVEKETPPVAEARGAERDSRKAGRTESNGDDETPPSKNRLNDLLDRLGEQVEKRNKDS